MEIKKEDSNITYSYARNQKIMKNIKSFIPYY